MYIEARNFQWCKEHADHNDKTGEWLCKETGESISMAPVRRSIHLFPGHGGGSVRVVHHLYCEGCGYPQETPQENSSILEEDLMEIHSTGAEMGR